MVVVKEFISHFDFVGSVGVEGHNEQKSHSETEQTANVREKTIQFLEAPRAFDELRTLSQKDVDVLVGDVETALDLC